jgi:hypothetical protein
MSRWAKSISFFVQPSPAFGRSRSFGDRISWAKRIMDTAWRAVKAVGVGAADVRRHSATLLAPRAAEAPSRTRSLRRLSSSSALRRELRRMLISEGASNLTWKGSRYFRRFGHGSAVHCPCRRSMKMSAVSCVVVVRRPGAAALPQRSRPSRLGSRVAPRALLHVAPPPRNRVPHPARTFHDRFLRRDHIP